jgi:2-dehydropantoate 2-reductase
VKNVIRGATMIAAHVVEPGHVGLEFYSDVWVGPFEPSPAPPEQVERLANMLKQAGLPCIPMDDARGAQWSKVIFNSAVNPVGGLTRLHHGAAVRYAPTGALCEALLQEGEAVAAALGIVLHGDPRRMIAEGAKAVTKRNPSMLMDVIATRQTEIDFLNGAIADYGEKLGVPVTVNRTLWRLMKGLEHSWTDPS